MIKTGIVRCPASSLLGSCVSSHASQVYPKELPTRKRSTVTVNIITAHATSTWTGVNAELEAKYLVSFVCILMQSNTRQSKGIMVFNKSLLTFMIFFSLAFESLHFLIYKNFGRINRLPFRSIDK